MICFSPTSDNVHSGGQIRKVVGGFDLIYNNGAVSREKANIYASNLGMSHHMINAFIIRLTFLSTV